MVMVENQFQPTEHLYTEVRWCKMLATQRYRIGVSIICSFTDQEYQQETLNLEPENIGVQGLATPSAIDLRCPTCLEKAIFSLIANQTGEWHTGMLPLYSCSVCETTRTIPNILEFNRRYLANEIKSSRRIFNIDSYKKQTVSSNRAVKKILYVEDDFDIQTVAQMALEMVGGFIVKTCNNGHEALANVEAFQPDLILMDMMMPGMTGIDTLEKIHAIPTLSDIPVIIMTAKIQKYEIESYQRRNVLGVIPKPFDPMTLCHDINRIWQAQFNDK